MNIYKYLYICCALAVPASLSAQGLADALRFNRNDVVGTARSQAMGSAFGALGADLTATVINPAGLGVYRATELGLTLGVNVINNESNYFGNKLKEDRVRVPFSQMGVAFCNGLMRDETQGLVSSTFYVGYNRLANYASREQYADPMAYNSLLDYFCTAEQSNAATTGTLAYNAYLINDADDMKGVSYNVWENYLGSGVVDDTYRYDSADKSGLVSINKKIKTGGSKGDISFAYAANISQKVFIGGSLDIITYSYEETSLHQEFFDRFTTDANAPTNFSYRSYLDQDGAAINFKLGVIVRPINQLRIGFALHSPQFFNITENYHAEINNPNGNLYGLTSNTLKTDDFEYEYRFRSPSRFIASIAGVVGKVGIISVDYERSNDSRSKFSAKSDDILDSSDQLAIDNLNTQLQDNILKATNTIRVGVEVSALQPLYLRAGLRYKTSPVNSDYYYTKPQDYAISGGVGFRHNNFFADLTYVGATRKADHWVLPDSAEPYIYETNVPASLTTHTHSGLLTVGFRF